MKKRCIFILIVLCLFMTGCNNGFAESDYDSVEKLSKSTDRYAKENSVFSPIDGGFSLVVSKFDGWQTLWEDKLKESQSVEVDISFTLTKGKGKLVHVDAEGNVVTLIECTPETSTDGYVTNTISMTKGENQLKVVGFDIEDLDLKILFSVSQ